MNLVIRSCKTDNGPALMLCDAVTKEPLPKQQTIRIDETLETKTITVTFIIDNKLVSIEGGN